MLEHMTLANIPSEEVKQISTFSVDVLWLQCIFYELLTATTGHFLSRLDAKIYVAFKNRVALVTCFAACFLKNTKH